MNAYYVRLKCIYIYIYICGRELSLEPQLGIVLFGISDTGRKPNPQGFAQSHIGERRLPPLPYKHLA